MRNGASDALRPHYQRKLLELLSITNMCQLVSELPPMEWPEEVLWPLGKQCTTIFGNFQVAMDRTRTMSLIEALQFTGLSESNGEARKAIKNNAVMINRKKVNDFKYELSAKDALPNLDAIVIENGRYNFGIIELC